MTKARELADLIANVNHGSSLANKNFIINGNMSCYQRGSKSFSANSYGYTLDRWELSNYIDDTITVTQDSDVPTGEGFGNSMKITGSSGDNSLDSSDYMSMVTKLEGQNLQVLNKGTSSALPMTFSFWIKTTTTGTYIVEFADNDNTRKISKSYTVSSSNTWEKKEITIDADTTGTLDDDNNNSLWIQMWFVAGSNFTGGSLNSSWTSSTTTNTRVVGQVNGMSSGSHNIYITGVQLEIGKATAFEHEPFDNTLTKCHRYYTKSWTYGSAVTTTGGIITAACVGNINRAFGNVFWPTEMRVAPTVTWYSGETGTSNKWRNNSDGTDITAASAMAGIGTKGYGFVLSAGISGVTDSLHGHYEASAEL
jgi:hypothetical protein